MALLTVRVAAGRLGVGYSTLKRWVHSGRVRTTLTEGGHHRISEAEVDRLMAHRQPNAPGRPRPTESDESLWGLSARNRLHGFIEEVRKKRISYLRDGGKFIVPLPVVHVMTE